MIADSAVLALRCIAFGEEGIPKDRIAACSTLYKNGFDIEEVMRVLESLVNMENITVKDKDRVSAATLLMHITREMNTKEPEDIDEKNVSAALREQYVRYR